MHRNVFQYDWRQLQAAEPGVALGADPRQRLRILLGGFMALVAIVLLRAAQLLWLYGPAFREEVGRAVVAEKTLPAPRGRILSRDGTVLAYDRPVANLAVHYRYLEAEPNAAWLSHTARSRLSAGERRQSGRLSREIERIKSERQQLAQRLAALCGLSPNEWHARTARIQERVAAIARDVNRRHQEQGERALRQGDALRDAPLDEDQSEDSHLARTILEALFAPPAELTPAPIVVREELDYHVVVVDAPEEAAAEIRAHPELYPGVRIEEAALRTYPQGSRAAHVVGYLGEVSAEELADGADERFQPGELVGRAGVERQYQQLLRGRPGKEVHTLGRDGASATAASLPSTPGADVVLSIDLRLQETAELLLDSALRRRAVTTAVAPPPDAGGAVVVMEIESGEILAAASAPRFDPNVFLARESGDVQAILSDEARPLVCRVRQGALPPGSVFKLLTSAALLEEGIVTSQTRFDCQGYLDVPGRRRCYIYQHFGVGHGPITLAQALAESCNVFFYHHARELGPERLVDWAGRFGWGAKTGVDLPDETAGALPMPDALAPDENESLAIGQSRLTATPLQVARFVAAVAGDGNLVAPRITLAEMLRDDSAARSRIAGLTAGTRAAIRAGMERAVAESDGTAHGTLWSDVVPIAAKTGTAQTGAGQADHAWLAAYAPADAPQVAVVVVVEHGGSGAVAAGPVAKRLFLALDELGYLAPQRSAVHPAAWWK